MSESARESDPHTLSVQGAAGASCSVVRDDVGQVLVMVDLGPGRDGAMVVLSAAAAAYLAGGLAALSGVHHDG